MNKKTRSISKTTQFELAERRRQIPVQIFGGAVVTIRIVDADKRVVDLLKNIPKFQGIVVWCCMARGWSEYKVARALRMSRDQVHGLKRRGVAKLREVAALKKQAA